MSENEIFDPRKNWVIRQPDFFRFLGIFQSTWASLELITDFAIYKFLKVTELQAHLITGGMLFGRRARLLADLIGRSDHPNRNSILTAFNAVRSNKRDVFAHSYMRSDSYRVTFIERPAGGNEATCKQHAFTLPEFKEHVSDFVVRVDTFYNAMQCDYEELQAFGDAAFNLDRKSTKSPGKPTSKS